MQIRVRARSLAQVVLAGGRTSHEQMSWERPMGRKRRVLTPERSAVHRWGAELRARRDERGLSLAGLGRLARYDASYLGRLERGDQFATLAVAEACDRVLDAGGELVRSWHAADRERRHADDPGAAGRAAGGGHPDR